MKTNLSEGNAFIINKTIMSLFVSWLPKENFNYIWRPMWRLKYLNIGLMKAKKSFAQGARHGFLFCSLSGGLMLGGIQNSCLWAGASASIMR